MKAETKLKLRKATLMALRSLIWHADEWLHRQEVQLREDLCGRKTRSEVAAPISAKPVAARTCLTSETGRPQGETFQQWEARRSGIAVISKKQMRRRGMPVRAFDLRFSER
jgi:hypothetical protein